MIISQLTITAVYPFFASGLLAALFCLALKSERSESIGVAGLAITAGYAMGFLNIVGFHGFPPVLVNDWLPYSALAGWLAFLFVSRARLTQTLLLALAWIAIWLWLYLSPLLQSRSTAAWAPLVLVAGACWLLLWWAWDWSCREEPRAFETLAVMVVCATGVSLISVLDGSAKLGQLGGSLAAACGALLVVRLLFRDFPVGSAARAVFLTLLGGSLLLARVYAEVSPLAVALQFLAALTILFRKLPAFSRLSPLKRGLAVTALCAIPTIIAIIYLILRASHDDYGY